MLAFLLSQPAFAGEERTHKSLSSSLFNPIAIGATLSHEDQYYSTCLSTASCTGFNEQSGKENVILRFDDTQGSLLHSFKLTVTYDITVFGKSTVGTVITGETIKINYNSTTNYSDIAINQYDPAGTGTYKASIKITNIDYWDQVAGTHSTSVPSALSDVFLDLEQVTERFYQLTSSSAVSAVNLVDITSSTVAEQPVNWPVVQGAESYDVEWLFVDCPCNTCATSYTTSMTTCQGVIVFPAPDYANAARVNVTGNQYSIPLCFPPGYVRVRVRPVGKSTSDFTTRAEGAWKESTVLYWGGLERKLNWQFTENYAEDGKHKEVISFFDGSLRSRQDLTRLNTDNNVIIAESKYDYEGRPSVSVLPVPLTSAGIKYYNNFNPGFDRTHFDIDSKVVSPGPDPLSNSSGAGNYYSSSNTDQAGTKSYTPDAQGYAYSQTTYMPDATGRVASQAGAGSQLHLGSGHETEYFYGTPSVQEEIDRLFGNEVGFVSHYKKNLVKDANGQLNVSYLDQEGRVIATALAGDPPTNLLPIDNKPAPAVISGSLLTNNHLDLDQNLVSEQTILIETAPTTYSFVYTLGASNNCYNCAATSTTICEACRYDLDINVIDVKTNASLYRFQTASDSPITDNSTSPLTFPITFNAIGTYKIVKKLSLNQNAVNTVYDDYLAQYPICNPPPTFPVPDCQTAPPKVVSECDMKLAAMKNDMSPGGQYFDNRYFDFNTLHLVTNAPNNGWLNASGISIAALVAYVNANPTSCGIISPGSILTWDDVRNHWQSCFADFLVQFHPEYCAYQYFCNNVCSSGSPNNGPSVSSSDFENMMSNSTDGNLDGTSTTLLEYMNPLGFYDSQQTCSTSDGTDFSHYISCDAMYGTPGPTGTPAIDPLAGCTSPLCLNAAGQEESDAGILNNWMHNFLKVGSTYYNLWYVIDDPQNIAGTTTCSSIPGSLGSCDVVKLFQTLHGNTTLGITGLIGTGTGQISKFEYFKRVYLGMRRLLISYTWAKDHAQMCAGTSNALLYNSDGYLKAKIIDGLPLDGGLTADDPSHSIKGGFSILYPEDAVTAAFNNSAPDCNSITGNTDLASNVIALGGTTPVSGVGGNAGTGQCEVNCENNVNNLLNILSASGCLSTMSTANYNNLKDDLISICTNSSNCNTANPQGGSGSTGCTGSAMGGVHHLFCTFDEAIAYYNGGAPVACSPVVFPPVADTYNDGKCSCTNFNDFLVAQNLTLANHGGDPDAFTSDIAHVLSEQLGVLGTGSEITQSQVIQWMAECATSAPSVANLIAEGFPGVDGSGNRIQMLCPATQVTAFTNENITSQSDIANAIIAQCAVDAQNFANYNAQQQALQKMLADAQTYLGSFKASCMNGAFSQELFTASFTLNEYLYTLYYYDQAGNLVRTVPPEGVEFITSTDPVNNFINVAGYRAVLTGYNFTVPPHRMVTYYKYNSLNQLVQQINPDHGDGTNPLIGTTQFFYDAKGRLIASQNYKQANYTVPAYSYTLYDNLGRIVEVGQLNVPTSVAVPVLTENIARGLDPATTFEQWMAQTSVTKTEVTQTFYEQPLLTGLGQQNLRNRVASNTYEDVYDGNPLTYDHGTHYSYDIHGNVQTLFQENQKVSSIQDKTKRIDYEYDLISGNVNAIHYQNGQYDQFHHRYSYDDDNRLTLAYTSRDGMIWEKESKQFYYPHGPMSRMEVGDKEVQGIDYAYTVQGWIKGVNSSTIKSDRDIGKDALVFTGQTGGIVTSSNLNSVFAQDVFGYSLGYYSGDYLSINNKIGTVENFTANAAGSAFAAPANDLFNGNISSMVTTFLDNTETVTPTSGGEYRYDQLNRLKQATRSEDINTSTNIWQNAGAGQKYFENFTYDFNGNIASANRYSNGSVLMDQLTYYVDPAHPKKINNRLQYVTDGAGSLGLGDIGTQAANNYVYDGIGNLNQDVTEEIAQTDWTVYGKLKRIYRTNSSTKDGLEFNYDASGNRVSKIKKPAGTYKDPTGAGTDQPALWTTTYYVHDAQGNMLTTYSTSPSDGGFHLNESYIYGGKRIGLLSQDVISPLFTGLNPDPVFARTLGQKEYENTNHLGNVLAVVSDRRFVKQETTHDYMNNFETVDDLNRDYGDGGTSIAPNSHSQPFCSKLTTPSGGFPPSAFTPNTVFEVHSGDRVDVSVYGYIHTAVTSGTGGVLVFQLEDEKQNILTVGGTLQYFRGDIDASVPGSTWSLLNIKNFPGGLIFYNVPIVTSYTGKLYVRAYCWNPNAIPSWFDDLKLTITPAFARTVYSADVLSAQDYYAFGALMPGRNYNAPDYRYGFNGKEKDDEIDGVTGSDYDYGMRMYDARLGRFMSVDPLTNKFAFYSPYQYAGNTPIMASDLDGAEPNPKISAEAISTPDVLTTYKYTSGQVIWKVDGYYVHVHSNYSNPNLNRYFYYEPSKEKGQRWTEFHPKTEQELGKEATAGTMKAIDDFEKLAIGAVATPLLLPVLAETGIVTLGSEGLATYFGTSTLRTSIDAAAQTAANGGDVSKLDVADALMNGFLTPGASAIFGGAIDYKPFNNNGNTFSLVGYNKDLTQSLFEVGAKYTFGRNGIVGQQIGKFGGLFSTIASDNGSSILQPVVTAPFTLGGKVAQSRVKDILFGNNGK